MITCSVTVGTDLSWSVFISGKHLTVDDTPILSDLPRHVNSTNALSVLLERVKSSNTCPGNPEHNFVEMFVKEGGQFLGTCGKVVATLDASSVVRASDCEMLSESRCAKCKSYRTHLRVKQSRANHCEESVGVAHISHAKYADLPRESLVERLKNTQKEKQSLKAKNAYLGGKLKKLLKQEGVKMSKEDSEDFSRLMDELTPTFEQDFDSDTPQHILWQEQIKYNQLKKKQQMCWHPLIIGFALSLLYSSRAAYHAVTSSGFLILTI